MSPTITLCKILAIFEYASNVFCQKKNHLLILFRDHNTAQNYHQEFMANLGFLGRKKLEI